MTSDSKLFPPRPVWEEQGYAPDEYGHWLKGGWRPVAGSESWVTGGDAWLAEPWRRARSILRRPEGLILSRDGRTCIQVADIGDVALPLYEGRMIDHFDFSAKGWVSGKGRSAVWRDIPWENKVIEPQYMMGIGSLRESGKGNLGPKLAYMRIGSATNWRTCVATFLEYIPAGDSVFFYVSIARPITDVVLASGVLASLAYDFQTRNRVGGLNLSEFVMNETSLLRSDLAVSTRQKLIEMIASLAIASSAWAHVWSRIGLTKNAKWLRMFAISAAERSRIGAMFEAVVGHSFGLSMDDYSELLRSCDYPTDSVRSDDFTRTLDPKGFWRVDKEKDPELRHTVLAQVAFQDLQHMGLDSFLAQNDGEGWMLPKALRLSDYGLGHDARASEPQPVASRLGPRFQPWQLEGTVEESWEECRRHAANLRAIRSIGAPPGGGAVHEDTGSRATDLLGQPIETDLLGQEIPSRPRRRRRQS